MKNVLPRVCLLMLPLLLAPVVTRAQESNSDTTTAERATPVTAPAAQLTANDLIRKAMDNWRGETSYSEMTMTIHREDWQRVMSMRSWSAGDDESLVRVTAPKKDAGTGSLQQGDNLWTYTPKINRIIKVPSSMMTQSWMGSDFSNNDISKSTDIVRVYTHEITAVEQSDGHTIYTVTSTPHEDAAVVWGKEVVKVRDDFVMLNHEFWDQDGILVKRMVAAEVQEMGGRPVARSLRMSEVDKPGEWTEVYVDHIEFGIDLPPNMFTQSNLRNPRQ